MKARIPNIPDFAYDDLHRPRRPAKCERVHKFRERENSRFHKDINTEFSVIPNMEFQMSKKPNEEKKLLEPYQQQFQINSVQEGELFWEQSSSPASSKKEFPDFKSTNIESKKFKESIVSKPNLRSSFEQLAPDQSYRSNKHFQSPHLHESRSFRDTNLPKKSIPYHSNISKSSKKVKWVDGYCAPTNFNWYSVTPGYENYYKGKDLTARKGHSKDDLAICYPPKYPKTYTRPDYGQAYALSKYSPRSSYPKYDYHNYKDYYNNYYSLYKSKYGNFDRWLYSQMNPKDYGPYYYNNFEDYYFKNDKFKFNQRTYKNTDTQYDLIDRVHNRKLQVSHSESSKISNQKQKVGNRKAGVGTSITRLIKSDQNIKKVENAGTQIDGEQPRIQQTYYMTNSDTKQPEKDKITATAIISRLLLELTDKLRSSEHSHSSSKKLTVDKITQYEDKVRNSRRSKPTSSRKKTSSTTLKKQKSYVKVLQHEETQYEDLARSSDNEFKTSSTMNAVSISDFERQFFTKNADRNNFCEMESTKKSRGLKSGVCEERIYAKRLVKKGLCSTNMMKGTDILDDGGASFDISSLDLHPQSVRHRSYLNTKHCLPFLIGNSYRKKSNARSKNDDIPEEGKKKERRRRCSSCEGIKKEYRKVNKAIENKITRSASSEARKGEISRLSSKSDFSDPDEAYLEKYIVKLSHPEEEIILYDVKPKFCSYLSNKGVKKKIVDRLKAAAAE